MYVTRPLSLYLRSPEFSEKLAEGPNSGYLVIQDEESTQTCCFGTCNDNHINQLPFPQNKRLCVVHRSNDKNSSSRSYDVYLIPVVNQPLSSNKYYAIKRSGHHKGEAYVSSKEEDMITCCFLGKCVHDVSPKLLDPQDIYQQFEFCTSQACGTTYISTESVPADGKPPFLFRRSRTTMYSKTPKSFTLSEAKGMDETLRARLHDFNIPASQQSSTPVVVGKWYVPFMFVMDNIPPKEQVKKSIFYEMTLEQRWERIFACENENYSKGNNTVSMDVESPTELVKIGGRFDASRDDTATNYSNQGGGRMVWFKSVYSSDQQAGVIGLSSLVMERMVWEEERFGWVNKDGKHVRGVRTYEYGQIGQWTKFGCYVLVDSFILRRIDGNPVLTYDFLHTDKLKTNWE